MCFVDLVLIWPGGGGQNERDGSGRREAGSALRPSWWRSGPPAPAAKPVPPQCLLAVNSSFRRVAFAYARQMAQSSCRRGLFG